MSKDIEKHVNKCETYKEFSNIRKPSAPTLQSFEKSVLALQPMQHVQMDIFEPKAGICYLVMVDIASNFLFVEKIRTKSCKNIILAMTTIFEHFGQPTVIGSDNMTGFAGKELQIFLVKRGIKWHPGAPYFSNHQQYAEGAICIVKRLSQKALATKASFSRLVFLHNILPNSLGKSNPFQIMYNRPANYSIEMPSPDQIPSSSSSSSSSSYFTLLFLLSL